MKTLAAVAEDAAGPFRLQTLEIDEPRADEIRVRIAGVGVCHTDLVFKSAVAGFPFPAVFGHEGSGIVEAVGANVTKVRPGDTVVMTFRSCGKCDRCTDGDAAYCRTMPALNYTGRRPDGSCALHGESTDVSSNFFGQSSFASFAITYERNVVKVDPDLPLEILGPLGCGVQTGAGAVIRSLNARPGSSILITGGGSVGLSAVMGAAISGCSIIILVEPQEARRALAAEFGATHVIDPSASSNLSGDVRRISPFGVDLALDTTGIPSVQSAALASLGSKGVLGLVGVSASGTPLPGDVNGVMTFGQSVRGIIEGDSDPDSFIPELIKHFRVGRLPFDRMVRTYPLSRINDAIADQHAGICVKPVLIPDSTPN